VDGFQRAYGAQYDAAGSQTGSPFWEGISTLITSAAVYGSNDTAHRSLRAARALCRAAPWRLLPNPGATVGDEAILCRKTLTVGGNPPPGLPKPYAFAAIWRTGSRVGEIVVQGFHGLSPTDAIQLAKKQKRRMSAAH
jgi:hypothetical protein